MGKLSAETFVDWLHPSDVIDYFLLEGDPDPKGRVISMLSDGLLQTAAGQLIINGRDLGLALIPRECWPPAARRPPPAARTNVWTTDRFHLAWEEDERALSISAYDVRIDRDIRSTPPADAPRPTSESDQLVGAPLDMAVRHPILNDRQYVIACVESSVQRLQTQVDFLAPPEEWRVPWARRPDMDPF